MNHFLRKQINVLYMPPLLLWPIRLSPVYHQMYRIIDQDLKILWTLILVFCMAWCKLFSIIEKLIVNNHLIIELTCSARL